MSKGSAEGRGWGKWAQVVENKLEGRKNKFLNNRKTAIQFPRFLGDVFFIDLNYMYIKACFFWGSSQLSDSRGGSCGLVQGPSFFPFGCENQAFGSGSKWGSLKTNWLNLVKGCKTKNEQKLWFVGNVHFDPSPFDDEKVLHLPTVHQMLDAYRKHLYI